MKGNFEESVVSNEKVGNSLLAETKDCLRNVKQGDIMIVVREVGRGKRRGWVLSGNRHVVVRGRQRLIQSPLAERSG